MKNSWQYFSLNHEETETYDAASLKNVIFAVPFLGNQVCSHYFHEFTVGFFPSVNTPDTFVIQLHTKTDHS